MKEVFILGDDNALAASGVLAKIGVGGFRKAGVKDVLTIHALLAEIDGQGGWQLVIDQELHEA